MCHEALSGGAFVYCGGRKGAQAAAGWAIAGQSPDGTWTRLLSGAQFCPGATVMDAELLGAEYLLRHLGLLTEALAEASDCPTGAAVDWFCPLKLLVSSGGARNVAR